ncbi:MAG TPA: hypothetical protein VM266_05985, partial [Solirubrobacteraceae bacterium]|nr:hypothetical protein [Solirubrobacteraceae bacterium]
PSSGTARTKASAARFQVLSGGRAYVRRLDKRTPHRARRGVAFAVAPVAMGADKFAEVLTDDWARYLAPQFNDILPGSAADAMHAVGVVEILAGLVVLTVPRFGALLVAGWLGGIIVSLLLVGGYGDVAFRDFGLLLAVLTLARLAWAYDRRPERH